MNKFLYDKEIEFPSDKREHMRKCFHMAKNAPKDSEGYKRNLELQNKEAISYKQLKRIKNFFDNFKGNQKDSSYILNGGTIMRNWVNDELRKMREADYLNKRNKMDTGMQNQFLKPHEKKHFDNVRKSKEHSSVVSKYDAAVTESLKRINELMLKN